MDADNHRRMNLFKTGARVLEIASNSCLYGEKLQSYEVSDTCTVKTGGLTLRTDAYADDNTCRIGDNYHNMNRLIIG